MTFECVGRKGKTLHWFYLLKSVTLFFWWCLILMRNRQWKSERKLLSSSSFSWWGCWKERDFWRYTYHKRFGLEHLPFISFTPLSVKGLVQGPWVVSELKSSTYFALYNWPLLSIQSFLYMFLLYSSLFPLCSWQSHDDPCAHFLKRMWNFRDLSWRMHTATSTKHQITRDQWTI